jgi:hypothetical protein
MPLFKTFSGADKQVIKPEEWTLVRFDGKTVVPFPATGWSAMEVMLRVEYPRLGCPRSLRGRFVRWPNTPQADETGHDDKATFPGLVRHHHWQHFILNQKDLVVGFILWHDGKKPIVLDGRQFKTVRLK